LLAVPEVGIAPVSVQRIYYMHMSEDWSEHEVEIIVEDYLTMLELELRGKDNNKAKRNRELRKLLPSRSRGSIEFKHANISAVMLEMGYPYVDGYKPRKNLQNLLRDAVERRVHMKRDLTTAVAEVVDREAQKPVGIADLLSIQVAPPKREKKQDYLNEDPPRPRVVTKRNYLEQEARNQSLGLAGEELVMEFEHKRLWVAGAKALAERIAHVSKTEGDGCGFDILSFETDGRERLVEVKTTRFGALTPFFATKCEVEVSDERGAEYHVYRLFDFGKSPRLFTLSGPMRNTCNLEAVQFRATPGRTEE
jgi:hypothetical protein